jgi:hypothetical protein
MRKIVKEPFSPKRRFTKNRARWFGWRLAFVGLLTVLGIKIGAAALKMGRNL